MAVNVMSPDDRKRAYRKDMLLASAMVAAGLTIFGLSLAQLARNPQAVPQVAQATQPLQPSPTPAPQDNAPAQSKPGLQSREFDRWWLSAARKTFPMMCVAS